MDQNMVGGDLQWTQLGLKRGIDSHKKISIEKNRLRCWLGCLVVSAETTVEFPCANEFDVSLWLVGSAWVITVILRIRNRRRAIDFFLSSFYLANLAQLLRGNFRSHTYLISKIIVKFPIFRRSNCSLMGEIIY